MKTKKNYAESVLLKNSMFIIVDGNGNVLIHSETGKKSERIRCVLSNLRVEFGFEYYREEMVNVDDYNNPDIEDEDLEIEMMEMTKFKLKIDDLKNDCPSLYSRLTEKNRIDQMVRQYLTDNNLLDGYVLN